MAATPELAREFSPYGGIAYGEQSLGSLVREGRMWLERAPPRGSYPQQWTRDGPSEMRVEWRALWTSTCETLADQLQALQNENLTCSSILGYLFSRIGVECGTFIRELHKLDVSWGTYQDAMCRRDFDEWHCNAHANNMVLLPETIGQEKGSFLCYLDLDMAFSHKHYIDTWAAEGTPTSERTLS
eukprot:4174820-Amphidinium_carterae.2